MLSAPRDPLLSILLRFSLTYLRKARIYCRAKERGREREGRIYMYSGTSIFRTPVVRTLRHRFRRSSYRPAIRAKFLYPCIVAHHKQQADSGTLEISSGSQSVTVHARRSGLRYLFVSQTEKITIQVFEKKKNEKSITNETPRRKNYIV